MQFDTHGNISADCEYCGATVPYGTLLPHTRDTGTRFTVEVDYRAHSVPVTSKATGSRIGYFDPAYKSLPRFETRNACAPCRGVARKATLQPRLCKAR